MRMPSFAVHATIIVAHCFDGVLMFSSGKLFKNDAFWLENENPQCSIYRYW